jgi:hypothetical protein
MITLVDGAVVVGALAAGFGIGRIKNASKLKAISAEIAALEAKAKSAAGVIATDVLAAIAKVKTYL